MANAPEPLDPSFQITLPAFEGPLDLLLHLIKAHELDILDLPIAFVTERYLAYVSLMEKLNLDIASEYLVMAATLAHIKSKMLLPQEPADQEEEEQGEEIDPRAELIRRLLEYQKYKLAAEQLGARGIAGRDVFPRGSDAPEASGPAQLADIGLFALLDAFNGVLARARADLAFQITAEGVSIQDRMRQLTDLVRDRRELTFEQLFEGQATIYDLVITFLALLEMAKRRLVRVYQADPSSPIHLRSTVLAAEEGEENKVTDADAAMKKALEEAELGRESALDRSGGLAREAKRPEGEASSDESDEELDREAIQARRSFEGEAKLEDEEALDRDAVLDSRVSLEEKGFEDQDALDRDQALGRWGTIEPGGDEVPAPETGAMTGPSVFDGFKSEPIDEVEPASEGAEQQEAQRAITPDAPSVFDGFKTERMDEGDPIEDEPTRPSVLDAFKVSRSDAGISRSAIEGVAQRIEAAPAGRSVFDGFKAEPVEGDDEPAHDTIQPPPMEDDDEPTGPFDSARDEAELDGEGGSAQHSDPDEDV